MNEQANSDYIKNPAENIFINKIADFFLAGIIVFNGILNFILGEIISEGLCISLFLIYLCSKIKTKIYFPLHLVLLIIFILISIAQAFNTENQIRLLFLYPYLFFMAIIMLPVYEKNSELDSNFIAKIFIYFAVISSLYAVSQRLGFSILLSVENEIRATGLSRSSLNLTGCLFSALAVCLLTARKNYKSLIFELIIFLGLVAAGGRGGMISAIILLVCIYLKDFKNNKKLSFFMVLSIIIIAIITGKHFQRAFSAFNFSDDQSNLERLDAYLLFFKQFQILGGGIGTTSPAVMRFASATGFESSLLNIIYELGIGFSIIFAAGIIAWFTKLQNTIRKNLLILAIAILPMFAGQQLYGIPSAFVSLILCTYIILSNRERLEL